MAKAIRFHETGGPEVLRLESVEVGEPGPGQARVRHSYIAVNFIDTYFRTGRFEDARGEFEAVVERAPTNDYALFCLGRSLMQLGRHREARKPLTLAANMNPKRRDYRIYRDRARKAA